MSDDGVRPMDFGNILDWFERHSINPLGTPFYSDDTPLMLAEYFAESFGIDWTPENVETPQCFCADIGESCDICTPENVECQTCGGEGRLVNLGRFGDPYSGCPDCGYCE